MKYVILLVVIYLSFQSCEENSPESDPIRVNWNKRVAKTSALDSLEIGQSYLSIYSQIYSFSQHKTFNLTAMVSLRNTSINDTLYLLKANYYGAKGSLLKKYIESPVFLAPLETLEIVINESDISGGTGSNFLFDWGRSKNSSEPLFEGIMTSTVGQQGLSFTTQAKRLN